MAVNKNPNENNISLSGKLLSGAVWSISIRWTSKLLGIISLAICARILTPADYGLVGMAMVVVGFSSLLVELGLETSLIRAQNPTAELYNTAWSMRIIQRGLIATIVIIAAPYTALIYKDERITMIMVAVGLAELICAFENIYTVNLRKNLNFKIDFIYMAAPRFASFLMAVSSVIILENYWGLVIGICTMELARTIVSYNIVKERPKWSLEKWNELFGFSTLYMLRGLGDFISSESDRFFLGVLGGPKATGLFSVAKEVASLPVTEIVLPLGRALTPTLAKIASDQSRLSSAIEKSLAGTIILAAPISLGFSLVSSEFVQLLFGQKWIEATPILKLICLGGIAYAIKETASNALIICNRIHLSTSLSWINAILIVSLFYPVFLNYGTMGVAWLLICTGALTSVISIAMLSISQIINLKKSCLDLSRPILSAIFMYAAVNLTIINTIYNIPVTLFIKVTLGAAAYLASLFSLWLIAGRPNSTEKILVINLGEKIFGAKKLPSKT